MFVEGGRARFRPLRTPRGRGNDRQRNASSKMTEVSRVGWLDNQKSAVIKESIEKEAK